jgi:hypothetical protein
MNLDKLGWVRGKGKPLTHSLFVELPGRNNDPPDVSDAVT